MYVRTWKDSDMVATSDSGSSGSTSGDEQDRTAAATESSAEPDVTEPPSEPAADPTPTATTAATPAATPTPASSTTSTESTSDAPKGNRARRSGPTVSRDQVKGAVNGVRERLAALVWIIAVVLAVVLAAGALLIALDANPNNDLVDRVVGWAGDLDGPFNNMFTFDGDNAATKEALVNWGLAALAWLIGGKIVSSIIRP
jgi:hypothetical protein